MLRKNEIESAKEEYRTLVDEMESLVDLTEKENRTFTKDERGRWEHLRKKSDDVAKEIREMEEAEAREIDEGMQIISNEMNLNAGGSRFRTPDGRELRAYRHHERLTQQPKYGSTVELQNNQEDDYLVGRAIYSMVTGLPMEGRDFQSIGSVTTGGYLVNDIVSRRIIDLARSASVTMRAGAETLPIPGPTRIARVTADPTSYWRAEGEAISASNMTFDALTLQPKTLACLVPISIELAEDSAGIVQQIERVIAASMGQKLDQAVLRGAGSANEPLGIRNSSDVTEDTSVGTPSTYAEIVSAVQSILTANYDGDVSELGWVAHPRDWATYQGLVTGISSDNTPLQAPEWAGQLRRFSTTAMSITEGGGAESSMIIGDFSQVVVGLRTNITMQVLDSGQASDGVKTHNALTEMKRWIRIYMRADVGILRPTWFVKLTGVTNT